MIDFPSVCENCLPDNPYVQMLKEDHGAVSEFCLPMISRHMTDTQRLLGVQNMHKTLHHIPMES